MVFVKVCCSVPHLVIVAPEECMEYSMSFRVIPCSRRLRTVSVALCGVLVLAFALRLWFMIWMVVSSVTCCAI